MKIAFRALSLLILAMVATFYAGCKKKGEDPETEEKKQLDKLVGQWTLVSATDFNGDRTSDFVTDNGGTPAPLVLDLQGNYAGDGKIYNYSLTGKRPNPSPWPISGTWKFGNPKTSKLLRDPNGPDEIEMNYTVTETDLILEFTVPDGAAGWPGGRVQSVTGDWTFTFSK
jgi:hypothetical protein